MEDTVVSPLVGMKDEYESFYKLYSKYAHPYSWIINSDDDEQQQYWESLHLTAQLYANQCLSEGEDFQLFRESSKS